MAAFIYNRNAQMLYKDTEIRYLNDEEVDEDDLTVMCNMLYQKELLDIFGLSFTEEPDLIELTNRIEALYDHVKMDVHIIEMIRANFFQDDLTTFISLFSYDTLHTVHTLICNYLK